MRQEGSAAGTSNLLYNKQLARGGAAADWYGQIRIDSCQSGVMAVIPQVMERLLTLSDQDLKLEWMRLICV